MTKSESATFFTDDSATAVADAPVVAEPTPDAADLPPLEGRPQVAIVAGAKWFDLGQIAARIPERREYQPNHSAVLGCYSGSRFGGSELLISRCGAYILHRFDCFDGATPEHSRYKQISGDEASYFCRQAGRPLPKLPRPPKPRSTTPPKRNPKAAPQPTFWAEQPHAVMDGKLPMGMHTPDCAVALLDDGTFEHRTFLRPDLTRSRPINHAEATEFLLSNAHTDTPDVLWNELLKREI